MVVEQRGHEFKATISSFSNKIQRRQVRKQVPRVLHQILQIDKIPTQQKLLMTNASKDAEWQSSSS